MPIFYKPPHDDLTQKISKLTDLVGSLTNSVSTQGVKHENLATDHRLLDERVSRNEQKLEDMQKTTNNINSFSKLVQVGGIAAAGFLYTLWSGQTTKIDVVASKTENNIHSIEQLRKESDEQERKIDENKAKIIANREAILSDIKNGKLKGIPDE